MRLAGPSLGEFAPESWPGVKIPVGEILASPSACFVQKQLYNIQKCPAYRESYRKNYFQSRKCKLCSQLIYGPSKSSACRGRGDGTRCDNDIVFSAATKFDEAALQ